MDKDDGNMSVRLTLLSKFSNLVTRNGQGGGRDGNLFDYFLSAVRGCSCWGGG